MNFVVLPFPASLGSSQKKPKPYRIYIHTTHCTQNKLKAGDLMMLSGSRKTCIQIWPNSSIPLNTIYLSSLAFINAGLKEQDMGLLETMQSSPLDATQITLSIQDQGLINLDDAFLLYAKEFLIDIVYVSKDMVVDIPYMGTLKRFLITQVHSRSQLPSIDGIYKTVSTTKVSLINGATTTLSVQEGHANVGTTQIGGLSRQVELVKELIQIPLFHPQTFTDLGLDPPKGILLFGPPGTGKTLLARAVVSELNVSILTINGSEILSKYYGETEKKLQSVFDEARQKSPCIIFIDEMDGLCPKRSSASSELEKRIVASLLSLMDGIDTKMYSERIVIIGATNRPNELDDAFRRPGRLDREIEIGIPNALERLDILQTLLRNVPNELTQEQVSRISLDCHGYVGADLAALIREAGLKSLYDYIKKNNSNELDLTHLKLTFQNFEDAKRLIKPSAMREIFLEVPQVKWTDIGGQSHVKQKLIEAVEWPLKHPDIFIKFHIKPPKGILLYGPPGCSKTLMAKALATEAGLNFIAIKGPELFSKWVGESEKAIQQVFKRARAASPSIVFFDEIDSIAIKRESEDSSVGNRVLSQLLNEMDGIEPLVNVTVIAATNRPDILDPALLRPGRIDRMLYISPPDIDSRREILKLQTSKMSIASDVHLETLAELTQGFSGAETVYICSQAGFEAMQENINADKIEMKHFLKAIHETQPRITDEMLKFYADFEFKHQ